MEELFGGDMTGMAQHGCIWSQEMIIKGLAPMASAAGKVKYVSVPMGSLYNQGHVPCSIKDLQAGVDRSENFKGTIKLRNAIV